MGFSISGFPFHEDKKITSKYPLKGTLLFIIAELKSRYKQWILQIATLQAYRNDMESDLKDE